MLHSILASGIPMCYLTRAMAESLNTLDLPQQSALTRAVRVESLTIRLIRLPLKEPFETSFGSIDSRLIFLVSVQADGLTGWGEVAAAEEPRYSYETAGTALHVIRDFLAQSLMAAPVAGLTDLAARFAQYKGHNMAKAGLELA